MKILGIHLRSHDTSVAYIEDGQIKYAASNERFSRLKMDRNAPLGALKNFFEYTKVKPEDIDVIIFPEDPFPLALKTSFRESFWGISKTSGEYLIWLKRPAFILAQLVLSVGFFNYFYRFVYSRYRIEPLLSGFKGKYLYDHHHTAHIHSAYYSSGWDECLVMGNEGSGFPETVTIHSVKNGKWKEIVASEVPDSMGKFYEIVTELLGFDRHRHPGKITGLSAYGNPKKLYKYTEKLMWVKSGKLRLNCEMYLKLFAHFLNNKNLPEELSGYSREDIAAAFQRRLEDCIVDLVRFAVKKSGMSRIALAGGVAANVKANQRIHEVAGIKEIHVHQAMGDDGLALGAAMHAAYINGEKVERPENVYFGPDFSDAEIVKILNKYKLKFKKPKQIEKQIAKLIADKKIIARFDGRMEYGPRALGNRSILYHTQDKTANDWLNKRLNRTEFMPFAPVVLDRFADKCFKNLKGAEYSSRFMTITFNCTDFMKKNSPACVHVDGTARPQVLRAEDNPKYYKILEEYHRLTGIPALVNTSFNMHEEPIVCTPNDAVRAFLSSGVDFLAIGENLVSFKENETIAAKFRAKPFVKKKKSQFRRLIEH